MQSTLTKQQAVYNRLCIHGRILGYMVVLLFSSLHTYAQGNAKASARIDAKQILVGDQARLFLEVHSDAGVEKLQWAVIPDSFNNLEVVEKGKIDTIKQGNTITYRQRLLITGFDSGLFRIPSFVFPVIPNSGNTYTVQSDSFDLLVQTVAVDTTKGFKGIKGIIYVKSTWLDYIWYIVAGLVFLVLFAFVIIYFMRNKKVPGLKPAGPVETLQDKTLRMLNELETKQLWQKNQVKEYYVELTDIVRNYIEARFDTPTLELTTDEILTKVQSTKELHKHYELLSVILYTADLAKFAKAQPTPLEHTDTMDRAKQFVDTTRPVIAPTTGSTEQTNPIGK